MSSTVGGRPPSTASTSAAAAACASGLCASSAAVQASRMAEVSCKAQFSVQKSKSFSDEHLLQRSRDTQMAVLMMKLGPRGTA